MEADVALHAPEAWVTSADPRAEKIKYVYGNRRKEREGKSGRKSSSRIQQMKPSRSYDNEIESSIKRDADLSPQVSDSSHRKSRDDSSLKYFGEKSAPSPAAVTAATVLPASSPSPKLSKSGGYGYGQSSRTRQSPELKVHRDHHAEGGGGGGGEGRSRWRPKSKTSSRGKPPAGERARTESRKTLEKQSSLPDSSAVSVSPTSSSHQSLKPSTSVDDQLRISAKPKITTLDLSGPVHSGLSQGIVLEMKHGPALHYKPSETMLSDSSPLDCWGATRSSEVDVWNPDERPLPALRNRRPANYDGTETVKTSLDDDDDRISATPVDSAVCASSGFDSAATTTTATPQVDCNVSKKVKHDDVVVGPSSTSHKKHFDGQSSGPCPQAFTSLNALQNESDETAFSSPSIIFQQKAGIQHDDMIVGPAFSSPSIIFQQKAGIRHDDMIVGPVSRLNPLDPYGLPPCPAAMDSGSSAMSAKKSELPTNLHPGTTTNLRAEPQSFDSPNTANLSVSPSRKVGKGNDDSDKDIISRSIAGVNPDDTLSNDNAFESPSTTKSVVKMTKDGNKKPRGRSPGSGIPLRRSGDRSRDRSGGTSPSIGVGATLSKAADLPPASPPTVSEDSKYESSQSLPGCGENVRWRPKDKKSGPQRMRRQGKKEKNVSIESGYVTDHAFYAEATDGSTGFSPEHHRTDASYFGEQTFHSLTAAAAAAHGSLDRKSKPARTKHVPGSPSSRSKSAHTTPTKKSGIPAPSRGQPLRNIPIPVPICHDERVRKPRPKSPEPKPEPLPEPKLPSPIRVESPASMIGASGWNRTESFDSASQESVLSGPTFPGPLEAKVRDQQASILSTSRATATSLPSSCLASSSTASLPAATALSVAPSPSSPSSASAIPAAIPSVVKPRLHRSAEHLLANTKLTIYRGPDDGDQPDSASDVSVATACSMPAKTATQSNLHRADKTRAKACSSDVVDRSGLSGKRTPMKGRCVSLLRREKERSTAIVRRGSDRAVPVDRNDPSAVGLKAATSLKELCQSMASLLNIDNERAAEMLSTSLSNRQDLVEGLDADAILDYLTHHGVLDLSALVGLEVDTAQRNSVILRQVEEHGDTAVALFINALRQSGQLHLASSLDTEQRIKPVSGNSYFGKSRHKGEICVRLEVESLKILAPREPTERNVNLSLLSSPSHGNDFPTVLIDDEDDQVKPKSCWCFCLSRKRKSSRSSSKKDRRKTKCKDVQQGEGSVNGQSRDSSLPPFNARLQPRGIDRGDFYGTPHRTKSMDRERKNFAGGGNNGSNISSVTSSSLPSSPHRTTPAKSASDKKKSNKKTKHKSSGKPDVPATIQESDTPQSMPEVAFRSSARKPARSKPGAKATPKDLPLIPAVQNSNSRKKSSKDISDGIIMEYDAQLELVKLRAGHDELASPTRQAGPVGILVEQWKCSGKHFCAKSEMLCQSIVDDFVTDIIKYFEQDRGTLVLDVVSEGTAVVVFNICMTKAQVQRLQEECENGRLLEKMQELFTSKVDIAKFDIRGVQYRMAFDEDQLNSVLSELS